MYILSIIVEYWVEASFQEIPCYHSQRTSYLKITKQNLVVSSSLNGNVFFIQNSASKNGGALYTIGTNVTVKGTINITLNSAQNGGAMYLESGAFLL